jgi:putative ABC transport system substrate-binding protein
MRRREFIALIGGAATWPLVAHSQQAARVAKIGFLGAASLGAYAQRVLALQGALRDLGYVEGQNIEFDFRWAEGNYDRLPKLVTELLALHVDVLVTHGTPGTLAAKHATTTTPIVMAVSGDAVATGIVQSLAHPGGNVTGSTILNPELITKRLELAKEALPTATQMGFLFNSTNSSDRLLLETAEQTAEDLKLKIAPLAVRSSDDIAATFSQLRGRLDALIVTEDGVVTSNAQLIAGVSREIRLPVFGFTELTEAGGFVGYAVNIVELFRRAAVFVDKIIKGTKPGDIPVEQPTKFALSVNIKTAKALGLSVSDRLLALADEVIE